jgi:glycosyltransferase involved in cell wall biosynthesis
VSQLTLTVSMAYWRCPDHVEKAVRSVLEQTHRDLRLVVVGDGEDVPLPSIDDPRLTVFRLEQNRGPYYADAVVLAATDSEWFTIHAADDWSEPDRFERLLAQGDDVDAVFGGSWQHRGAHVEKRKTRFEQGRTELVHVGSIATGVYRTEALRRVGGPHPDFRVAYDTMVVDLVLRALRWRHDPTEFGYHRVVRPDSLTRSPATGLQSPYRREWRRRRDALWNKVIRAQAQDWPRLLAPAAATAASVAADADRLRIAMRERELVAA